MYKRTGTGVPSYFWVNRRVFVEIEGGFDGADGVSACGSRGKGFLTIVRFGKGLLQI